MSVIPNEIAMSTLPTGLQVVTCHTGNATQAAVAAVYRAGSRFDPPRKAGLAHLVEHLVFQGARKSVSQRYLARGVHNAAVGNANTMLDTCEYYYEIPTNEVRAALTLEAERMSNVIVSRDELAAQKGVVQQEIDLRVTGAPFGGLLNADLPCTLFTNWSNAHDGFGTYADIENCSLQDFQQFYDNHYVAANCVIAVCSTLDHDAVVKIAEAAFSKVKSKPSPCISSIAEPADAGRDRSNSRNSPHVKYPAVAVGYRIGDVKQTTGSYANYLVMSQILAGTPRSKLSSALARRGATAQSSVGMYGPLTASSPDVLILAAKNIDFGCDRAVQDLTDGISELAIERISSRELAAAAKSVRTKAILRTSDLSMLSRYIARGQILWNDPNTIASLLNDLDRVSPTTLSSAAENLLLSDRATFIMEPLRSRA